MNVRLFVGVLALFTGAAAMPLHVDAQKGSGSPPVAGAAQTAAVRAGSTNRQVPVEELSAVVEKLIKQVENSSMPCETRNSTIGKLRILDDALLSGHLMAAETFAQAWRQDAWSQMSGGVMAPEMGSSIHNRLGHIQGNIDLTAEVKPRPLKKWKPLPTCELAEGSDPLGVGEELDPGAGELSPGTGDVEFGPEELNLGSGEIGLASSDLVGSYTPAGQDPSVFAKVLLKTMLGKVPGIGFILSGLVDLLWPQGTGTDEYGNELPNMFKAIVDESTYTLVASDLKGLGDQLMDRETGWNTQVTGWRGTCEKSGGFNTEDCVGAARDVLWPSFQSKLDNFTTARPRFQQNGGTPESDSRVKLLPLFAQYENLYLSFLRDGMLLHPYWAERTLADGTTGVDLDGDMAANAMKVELDPNYSNHDRGISYVNTIYNMGLKQQEELEDPSTTQGWNSRNAFVRDQTLDVLDYRDMWKFQNPRSYPKGVPGGVKLTRMIYSDMVGPKGASVMPLQPVNVAGPLKEITGWTKTDKFGVSTVHFVGALQSTSPPLLGPAQSGEITGNSGLLANHAHYFNVSALGPISIVNAGLNLNEDSPAGYPTSVVRLGWARGGESWIGYEEGTRVVKTFRYDGEVLATARATGMMYHDDQAKHVASGFVFGFRFADSFNPSGEAIEAGSNMCMDVSFATDTQAWLDTCSVPPKASQTWTYDPVLEQISVTDPANGNKYCLDSTGAWRGPAVVKACDDGALTYDSNDNPITSSQRWTITGEGGWIAKITHAKSGLVLTGNYSTPYSGAKLVLYNYAQGSMTQRWRAHDSLTGEIHGIGSGRCLQLPSTTAGTQVLIYDCNGNAAQQWTYNRANKELIYANAPSLCLEARGGGTSSGTAVQINNCSGAPGQRWTLEELNMSINQGGGGRIINDNSGLVMDVTSGNTANNSLVRLYTSNNTEAQQWSRTSSHGGAVYALPTGTCLHLANGTTPVTQTCNNPLTADQIWTYHPIAQSYSISTPGGDKCLEAANTGLAIDVCSGEPNQQWSRDFMFSTITNVGSGLVLDSSGAATNFGTAVTLTAQPRDADGNLTTANPSQQWVWSLQ